MTGRVRAILPELKHQAHTTLTLCMKKLRHGNKRGTCPVSQTKCVRPGPQLFMNGGIPRSHLAAYGEWEALCCWVHLVCVGWVGYMAWTSFCILPTASWIWIWNLEVFWILYKRIWDVLCRQLLPLDPAWGPWPEPFVRHSPRKEVSIFSGLLRSLDRLVSPLHHLPEEPACLPESELSRHV